MVKYNPEEFKVNHPLVMIHWHDSSVRTNAWQDVDDPGTLSHCVTVGYLVKKDKTHYIVAPSVGVGENNEYGTPWVIPKGCVAKVWELEEV